MAFVHRARAERGFVIRSCVNPEVGPGAYETGNQILKRICPSSSFRSSSARFIPIKPDKPHDSQRYPSVDLGRPIDDKCSEDDMVHCGVPFKAPFNASEKRFSGRSGFITPGVGEYTGEVVHWIPHSSYRTFGQPRDIVGKAGTEKACLNSPSIPSYERRIVEYESNDKLPRKRGGSSFGRLRRFDPSLRPSVLSPILWEVWNESLLEPVKAEKKYGWTFTTTKRESTKFNSLPGPCEYEPKLPTRRAAGSSLTRSPRSSSRTDFVPGPGTYEIKVPLSHPVAHSFGRSPQRHNTKPILNEPCTKTISKNACSTISGGNLMALSGKMSFGSTSPRFENTSRLTKLVNLVDVAKAKRQIRKPGVLKTGRPRLVKPKRKVTKRQRHKPVVIHRSDCRRSRPAFTRKVPRRPGFLSTSIRMKSVVSTCSSMERSTAETTVKTINPPKPRRRLSCMSRRRREPQIRAASFPGPGTYSPRVGSPKTSFNVLFA